MSKKILIVDDDIVNRLVLKMSANKRGYETIEAIHGEDALNKIQNNPDLSVILLDINMPIMDGYGVLEKLNTEPDFVDRKFNILITSANLEETFLKNIERRSIDKKNIKGYFEKPINIDRLFSTLYYL